MPTRRGVFAAVDLGASSGRVIVGVVTGEPGAEGIELHEVHRFPNRPVTLPTARGSRLHWDVVGLYRGVLDGLRAAVRAHGRLDGVGIDSWAVDVGMLDADGALLGTPVHYRDARTDGVPARAFATVPADELYARTGLQVQSFNTVFQLIAAADDAQTAHARTMLPVPDLIAYWLTGRLGAEVTNASTTGLLDARTRAWATDLADRLAIDTGLLPPLREPGTVIGDVRDDVLTEIGHDGPLPVIAVGSHDTASAVVGVPLASPRAAYVATGTWSLVGLELDEPVLTEASRAANFTNELGVDGTVRYLRNVTGLWVLQESLRTWEAADGVAPDLTALLAEAAALPALTTVVDVDDDAFVPPGDMPARIADAARRTGQPEPASRAAVVRCVVDSLALAHRRALRQAAELSGREVDVVHLVGGGARNALLCRMTAQAVGVPVLAGPVESAALGNLLVQARAAGVLDGDLAALRSVGARGADLERYEPDGPGAVGEAGWRAAEHLLGG
ncbi:rhamnulokinase [Cellulomonas sp. APG4]|uniref:rhamnulokinase n=1 Tax=Cellulomonas sp. APG4 TaxID=1538656 RepID=UPI001379C7FE|nr:rhamnulokinase family protein [Cellulomonas sp. APG4]NCT91237.1 rhamnulokinase [Cellulomonas sp. APG4]